jgi:hypothetical protein
MDNMKIYEATRAVPQEAQKQFSNGSFSGTDINPMWRIKTLTEQFGPCGIGWYYEVTNERAETYGDTVMAIVDLNLYIKVDGEWSKPIFGTGGNQLVKATKSGARPSDEGYKMALTDALSVACKALGIGADIYFSADKTKYTKPQETPEPYKPAFDAIPMIKQYCEENEMTSAEFTAARDACINAKLLPRIAYNNMTEQDCLKMLEVITLNRLNEAQSA